MATWQEIKSYIHSNYQVQDDEGDLLTVVVGWRSEGRSQLVTIASFIRPENQVNFIRMFSPFAKLPGKDAGAILQATNEFPFGIGMIGDFVGVTHVQLADTVDGPEIDLPIRMVTEVADEWEKRFTGGDDF